MAKREIRPIRVDGQVAYVPLTKGYTAIIDAEDVRLVEGRNWRVEESKRPDGSLRVAYAVRLERRNGHRVAIRMHRVILDASGGHEVDHHDGDGLNNRRSNLRAVTKAQNQYNQRLRPNNKSGVKGVFFYQRLNKWGAAIRADGHQNYLGVFRCPTAAAFAYARASRELHGEFGRVA